MDPFIKKLTFTMNIGFFGFLFFLGNFYEIIFS